MAGLSALWSSKPEASESTNSSTNTDESGSVATMSAVTLAELEEKYNLLEVHDEGERSFAVVSVRDQPDMREMGTTSPSPWTSFNRREYNPSLLGKFGLEQFDKMRKSDGTVRGTLRLFKTPVLAANWFVEPGGTRKMDKKAADFVWEALTKQMSISWTQVLTEALLMCDFGYYMFEKVYENRIIDGQMRTVWKKLAPRHPLDIESWELDANGGPVGCWFYTDTDSAALWADEYMRGQKATQTVNMPGSLNTPVQTVSGIPNIAVQAHPISIFIPIDKLLVFTFDKEAGNIEGVSVLRSAYKHWYYKEQLYKIDAIQKERHGIGIPVIKLPMGYKNEDKLAAEDLGRNIRTNERAHIVLPPGWDVMMLKLEGTPMDCMKSVEHHDKLIEKNIGAYFLHATGAGSAVQVDMFLKATRFLADNVVDTFNMYCIPQLMQYNFPNAELPQLKYRHIGDTIDWRTMSFAIRNFIGAGVIKPDDKLEENIRDEMGLPAPDPATVREVATPQAGPSGKSGPAAPKLPIPGAPRQAPVGKQRNTKGLPHGNAGVDKSGG